MFDLGWDELGLIIVLAVIILGPKELPTALRTLGRWTRRIRGMAREFQRHIDDVVREAELEEVRDGLKKARTMDFGREIEKQVDPTGDFTKDLNEARKDLDLNTVPRQAAKAAEARPTDDPARPVADMAPAQAPASAAPPAAAPASAPAAPAADEPRRIAGGEGGA
ncbi:Sec-independent protein translocase protein TatB [Caenispirillum bisanense]|uniref:Sec-independent protein translocase protein TatB n=1 Tax=Caenispirillum bisanense TaxID=414052 RepID=A0A286H032_9PROT|nr:Sec-independent protein translocase protein TatB [Caenispirillum bisanense]SOE01117.1 sec-independent protein translocase protein TatB [Caenispirillum bisanense]